jgi:hypothetical protein
MFPYDPALAAAAATQPQSIADVLQIMNVIETTCADGDGLKWFNWLYLQVTGTVEAGSPSAWLAELDVQFARLYFGALNAALSGRPAPGCWRALFAVRNQPAIARIQFALAGINAHINHDLSMAVVATGQATGTSPRHGTEQYREYTAVNGTLESLVESAKHTLNVRLLGDCLPPVTHVEDTIAAWSVTAARESAWNNAEILWHLRAQPALSGAFLNSIDGLTTVTGKTLLVPAV